MTEAQTAGARLETARAQTLLRVAELEREFAGILASAADGSYGGDDEHDPEGATVAFERQHVAALLAQARSHLTAIDAAARKLDAGRYDQCDRCGASIGAARLAARPAALTCVRCATRGLAWLAGDYGACFIGEDDGLHPVTQVQFREQVADVRLDRCLAHHQFGGDFAVAVAAGDKQQDVPLARGQRR